MRDRRTAFPSAHYRRLHVRVDRLEDAISHFFNVINELRRRVSTLEKKSSGGKSPEAAKGTMTKCGGRG
jgi:hypothetical protein